jgi:citrate lyase subunit beta/citryl-CoA lyase
MCMCTCPQAAAQKYAQNVTVVDEIPGPQPRRSCLSVPASSERMLDKATGLDADEIVADLEDAVAASAKDAARATLSAHLGSGAWAGRTISVRVNGPGTPWCHRDLEAVAERGDVVASVVLPKVESAGDLAFADRLLDGLEAAGAPKGLRLQALIETPAGLSRIEEIAAASPRLVALIIGYADLAASIGRRGGAAAVPERWAPAQHEVLRAARTHGLQAIDGPHLGTADDDAFRAGATWARDLGFDGKWAIHPVQVPALNGLFASTEEELSHARAVIEALDAAERGEGRGAVAVDGQMIDEAMRRDALRTLARGTATAAGA